MKRNTIAAIVVSVIWGLAFIPGCLLAVTSPMLSDSNPPNVISAILAAIAFPLLCLVSIAAVWTIWAMTRERQGGIVAEIVAALLPLLPVAYLVYWMRVSLPG